MRLKINFIYIKVPTAGRSAAGTGGRRRVVWRAGGYGVGGGQRRPMSWSRKLGTVPGGGIVSNDDTIFRVLIVTEIDEHLGAINPSKQG